MSKDLWFDYYIDQSHMMNIKEKLIIKGNGVKAR
jgi:hypothetical protein